MSFSEPDTTIILINAIACMEKRGARAEISSIILWVCGSLVEQISHIFIFRGLVSTVSTTVSKTASLGSNPRPPANRKPQVMAVASRL